MFEDAKIPMKKRVGKMAVILDRKGAKAIAPVYLLFCIKGRVHRFTATFDAVWVGAPLMISLTVERGGCNAALPACQSSRA
jgi:hypothetical protein